MWRFVGIGTVCLGLVAGGAAVAVRDAVLAEEEVPLPTDLMGRLERLEVQQQEILKQLKRIEDQVNKILVRIT